MIHINADQPPLPNLPLIPALGCLMGTHHAVAMVKWDVFRGGPSGSGSRVYDYAEFERCALVKSIIPLVFEGGWQEFPELHAIHRKQLRLGDEAQVFQQLASEIASVTARKKAPRTPRP